MSTKKLRKLPFREIAFGGVQCPAHRPTHLTVEHENCLKEWQKKAEEDYKNSFEYKQTEILNELIERLNAKA